MPRVFLRALSAWLLIAAAEIVQGSLRRAFLVPVAGEFRSGQIGAVAGSAAIVAVAILTIRWIGARTRGALAGIGILWLALMLAFEIYGGRVLAGYSWDRIAADYDIRRGGLLGFGMLILLLSPLMASGIVGIAGGRTPDSRS